MPAWLYFSRPSHIAFHNLTHHTKVPPNIKCFLGLGLKFCLRTEGHRGQRAIDAQRFRKDFFTKIYFAHMQDEPPALFLRSKWEPPPEQIPADARMATTNFLSSLHDKFRSRKVGLNLTRHQQAAYKFLRQHRDILVIKTDKNLGPAIINRSTYVSLAYSDHLDDMTTYRRLTNIQAVHRVTAIAQIINKFIQNYLPGQANDADRKFMQRSMQRFQDEWKEHSCPTFCRFYLLAKVHKTPLKTRPIVSVSSSVTEAIGKWVDHQLQILFEKHRVRFPYFLKSSRELVRDVTSINLPQNAKLFSCDAVSMYTNIDTTHALTVIQAFLNQLPGDDVHPGLLKGLEIVMRHCVLQFGSEFFVQLTGTAMGAPPAPMYATLYFAAHEAIIVPNFHQNLIFYRRYIDDGIGIWIEDGTDRFHRFQQQMDEFGKLRWEFTELQDTINFLDVNLSIADNKVTTRMHEKELNLYLYIPPHSAHPPGVLKSLIYGRIQQIHFLCNTQNDRTHFMRLLLQRLVHRGYDKTDLLPIFRRAIENCNLVNDGNVVQPPQQDVHGRLFLHVKYHPTNPPSQLIQSVFRSTLLDAPFFTCRRITNHMGATLSIDRLTVAYHRPPNIANRLSNRCLHFERDANGQIIFDD